MSHLQYVQSLTVPLSACLPTVKPTVIDVGIYVNSIGPVSSIDMVSSDFCTHVHPSPSSHMAALRRGEGGVAVSVPMKERRDRWTAILLSPGSARIKPRRLKSSPLISGQAGRDAASAVRRDKALLSSSVRLEACFHLQHSPKSWNGGASLMEVQGIDWGPIPKVKRHFEALQ